MIVRERRTYRFVEFVRDSLALLVRLPLLVRARLRRRVSHAFEEKLMLTVTAVNGCRYCAWFHEREAARTRVPPEEIRSLLSGAIDRPVGGGEASGLLFAQHWARSGGRPEPEAVARLRQTYGGDVAGDILLFLRLITLGNLAGNTFGAFLERARGPRAGAPGLWDELLVFLATVPLFGPIGWAMRRAGR
ncbi:MAG TPA: carboxymuconolactone decarboxylase family protein [Anaeromyxobacter sp.]